MEIKYKNFEIINLLLEKKKNININNQEFEYGITALHQALVLNNKNICEQLIKSGANINIADFFGNSPISYAISQNNIEIINYIINLPKINYNIFNLDGNCPLHIFLKSNNTLEHNILMVIIENTDLSIQNNEGETCIYLLLEKNLFLSYEDILVNKEINIFIKNIDNISSYDLITQNIKQKDIKKYEKIIDIICESYYNLLIKNKDKLSLDWEIVCSKNINKETCIKKINKIILLEHRSLPKIEKKEYIIDSGIFINYCFYTGSTIDILSGVIYLYNSFNNIGLEIIMDYPLSEYESLIEYYESIGLNYNFKLDIINFEIIWSYQKIFYPTYFDTQIVNKMKKAKYIIIPIGIETATGSHANILFWDVKNKIIERFEPNGSNQPRGLNYNPKVLDFLLNKKFKSLDDQIKYISPDKYLPLIGLQMLEYVNDKCKRIGDPNGFCGVWCIWWIFQKMKHLHTESSVLINVLIKEIKYKNINFKNLIRNFSKHITDIRDSLFAKFDIDINDWMTHNYDNNLLKKIDKYIIENLLDK